MFVADPGIVEGYASVPRYACSRPAGAALAAENGCKNIAFCCISTGVFRFPASRAAEIAVETARDFFQKESSIQRIIFNVFKDSDLTIYRKLLS